MQGLSKSIDVKIWFQALTILLILGLVTACDSQRNEYVEPPPPKVTVAKPLQKEVTDYLEFTGTTRAFREVQVRARVTGFLQSMNFTPGTMVAKGDLLFEIDPTEYQTKLDAAKAEMESTQAQFKRAKTEFVRAERLFKQKAGAQKDVVKWRRERDMALAALNRAKQKVKKASLDLSYTKVTAPINGRVSRNFVDVGNLVGEVEPTLLTTITKLDPMYVYFNLNERDLLKVRPLYQEKIKEKRLNPDKDPDVKAEIPLFLGLADEEGYPHEGRYDFRRSGVDTETGTIELRGVFPNSGPMAALLPGMFTRIRMPFDTRENALLVTGRAIGADQSGRYLLVVNSENTIEKKPIRMGRLVDGLRVIEEGLQPGEWVIVKGIQRSRPGAKVDPERVDMNSLTASALKAKAKASQDKASPAGGKPANAEGAQEDKKP